MYQRMLTSIGRQDERAGLFRGTHCVDARGKVIVIPRRLCKPPAICTNPVIRKYDWTVWRKQTALEITLVDAYDVDTQSYEVPRLERLVRER